MEGILVTEEISFYYFEVFINCIEVKREHDNVKKEKRIPFNASRHFSHMAVHHAAPA